ncbi:ABATE domain-containing protein [Promicromonospora sp. NPDC050249]|uniref:CGNR zinc finger domain-containing protein n=1 Tax=Promicromonospora sp. NPDC050249 TaxID=3154743 RepID=UPI00340B9DEC
MNHAFPCGTLALDFLGTLRARRNPVPAEKLGTPALLDDWFVESGMLDGAPGADEADLVAALELRESVYALVEARIAERPLDVDGDAIAVLNRHAAQAPVVVQLGPSGVRHSGSAAQGLAAIAREAAEILGGPDAALLRECGRPECTQVYLDRSRGHRREWCAMRTCGNRVKVSAYRSRHRDSGAGAAAPASSRV